MRTLTFEAEGETKWRLGDRDVREYISSLLSHFTLTMAQNSRAKFRGARTRTSSQSEGEGSGTEEGHELVVTELSQLQVGMRVEAMDKYGKWYVAKILELDESEGEVLVHFERWSSRYDEDIAVKSGRLRRLSETKLKELEREKEKIKKVGACRDAGAHWVSGYAYCEGPPSLF